MAQATDFRERHDAPLRRHLNASWRRRILLQRKMCSCTVVIGHIAGQHAAQVALTEYDHVVQTLTPDGSDQALRVWILPWAGWARNNFADTHAGDTASEWIPIDRIAIPQEPSRSGIVWK